MSEGPLTEHEALMAIHALWLAFLKHEIEDPLEALIAIGDVLDRVVSLPAWSG